MMVPRRYCAISNRCHDIVHIPPLSLHRYAGHNEPRSAQNGREK